MRVVARMFLSPGLIFPEACPTVRCIPERLLSRKSVLLIRGTHEYRGTLWMAKLVSAYSAVAGVECVVFNRKGK
jgi:hypothetical protein